MTFPEELLAVAKDLARSHPPATLHQASLRRAASTAYYALFHLLIYEATANWARPELRARLGRCFDHGTMKSASETQVAQSNTILKSKDYSVETKAVASQLRTVADAFIQAQQRRNDADYNMTKEWSAVEVDTQIDSVSQAFGLWATIRDEADTQAYLVSLLGSKERRINVPKLRPVRNKKNRTDAEI